MLKAVIFDLNGVFITSPKMSDRFEKDFGIAKKVFLQKLSEIMDLVRRPGAGPAFSYWEPVLAEWSVEMTEEGFWKYWFGAESPSEEMIALAKELKAKGIPATGTENYGGPVVTAGGLVFIAAAKDGKLRAFNKYTGKLLWEYQLPAPGFATPSVYTVNGKQYIVIACGGGKLKTKSGDAYVAFALP